jgi:hypothetical protein
MRGSDDSRLTSFVYDYVVPVVEPTCCSAVVNQIDTSVTSQTGLSSTAAAY